MSNGVDDAAYVKASFLAAVAKGEVSCDAISPEDAVKLLGTMQGGYNVATLIDLLDDAQLGGVAADQLKHTLLVFNAFNDVESKANQGNEETKEKY